MSDQTATPATPDTPDTSDADAYEQVRAEMTAEVGAEPIARVAEAVRAFLQDDDTEYVTLPGMRSKAWWDPAELADAVILERSAGVIHEELNELLRQRVGFQHYDEGEGGFEAYHTNFGWNVLYLHWACLPVSDNQARCPRTTEIMKSLPNLAHSAFFSALNGGGKLEAHSGPMSVLVTIHLGLDVPAGATFRVGTETRSWQNHKCLAFQDCFEHEAINPTDRTRFIFLIDTWHPDVKPVEREFLARWCQVGDQMLRERGRSTNVTRHRDKLDGVTWWQK